MIKRSFSTLVLLLCLLLPLQATAQEAMTRADYLLATGDTVHVRVHGEDDLTMRLVGLLMARPIMLLLAIFNLRVKQWTMSSRRLRGV